ncbi:16S rRNA (cytidine(1402)-2'-O)-methyltransferase [Lyticum sinuosum]|uniref:Ribosomal RNA small subunit methyltransferase I n=1 Tax=Lyticum sinuosum TaxID=1332059 RepID=A0AAE4VMB0_9RICK|nr:16S rRNA (cytidine(1402)-2'-O)-methyltransferase [Lyticum sinuosum]MDZ5761428.1 Ribosomal RNA small subunit methyltransferase I [Lyticum sinuosum]
MNIKRKKNKIKIYNNNNLSKTNTIDKNEFINLSEKNLNNDIPSWQKMIDFVINQQNIPSGGCLYVVATPIGNLYDITLRGLAILSSSDIILAENTIITHKILNFYNIKSQKIISFHDFDHNIDYALNLLNSGKKVSLVSDAGTPTISDPGSILIYRAKISNIRVIPIPGPSSISAAMSVSGVLGDNWLFVGFLPKKSSQKKNKLEYLKELDTNVIILESPYRILDTLYKILDIFGSKHMICIGREMTKMHEEIIFDTIENIFILYNKREIIKGEIVLIISQDNKTLEDNIQLHKKEVIEYHQSNIENNNIMQHTQNKKCNHIINNIKTINNDNNNDNMQDSIKNFIKSNVLCSDVKENNIESNIIENIAKIENSAKKIFQSLFEYQIPLNTATRIVVNLLNINRNTAYKIGLLTQKINSVNGFTIDKNKN